MPEEIEYFNARVRGMMSHLLDGARMAAAVNAVDINDWAETVRDSIYPITAGRLDQGAIPGLLAAIDRSIHERTHRLSRIPSGRLQEAVILLLAERDLGNLLAILTGVVKHIPVTQTLETVLAGGVLTAGQLEELARSDDPREVADRLTTWGFLLHRPVREAVAETRDSGLPWLRVVLAKRYMSAIRDAAAMLPYPVLRIYTGDRIDILNLMTTMMWRNLPTDRDPTEMFIRGGAELSRDHMRCILAADGETGPADCLGPGWLRNSLLRAETIREITGRISSIRETLEKELDHRYTRPAARDPLGLELAVAFLLLLTGEGRQLKLALARIQTGMPADQFREVTGDV